MDIKKALKREILKRRVEIIISLLIMVFMAYFVSVLVEDQILTGFDSYFSFFYVIIIDLLLLINIGRILSEERISFNILNDRLEVKQTWPYPNYILPLNKILYVDVHKVSKKEFYVLIITKKAYRKKYKDFNGYFIRKNTHYADTFDIIKSMYSDEGLSCIEIKKSGSRKYYLLYILYKSQYNIGFSKEAINYIKTFIEEYKL